MTTLKTRCIVPHGVVFLYDPTMIIDVPEDTGSAPILQTKNCISIWTIQDDEGEVFLTLSDDSMAVNESLVLEAILETEGKRLAFNDSGTSKILEIPVFDNNTRVEIFTNHDMYPNAVVCIVHPINTDTKLIKSDHIELPVPSEWRKTLSKIVESFARQDYKISTNISGVEPLSNDEAKRISENINSYGGKIVRPPEETWRTSVYRWMGGYWEVLVDLFTDIEGQSDLVLFIRVYENNPGYRFTIQSVHVP